MIGGGDRQSGAQQQRHNGEGFVYRRPDEPQHQPVEGRKDQPVGPAEGAGSIAFKEQVQDAVSVFKLNVEAHPGSANVYDSYAEALLKSGDQRQAILNYRKSLELNPENQNAREVLKELEGS